MTRPRKKQGNLKLSQSQPLAENEIKRKSFIYRLGALFIKLAVWGSVVVTIVSGFFYFLPRVTVEPSGVYDPSNPSPLTFTISNTNVVPLRDVQPALGVCFIDTDKNRTNQQCNGPAGTKLAFAPWFVKWLDVDEKYQIIIEDALSLGDSTQIQNANITIAVIYTPWFMPSWWRSTREFRFITRKLSNGKIYWVPVPLNR